MSVAAIWRLIFCFIARCAIRDSRRFAPSASSRMRRLLLTMRAGRIASEHPVLHPETSLVFLHGILGKPAHWIPFVAPMSRLFPTTDFCLAPVRCHRQPFVRIPIAPFPPAYRPEQRPEPRVGPHTLSACVEDIRTLFPKGPSAVIGHSFGGKESLHRPLPRVVMQSAFLIHRWRSR